MKKFILLASIMMIFSIGGAGFAGSYGPDGTIWEDWNGSQDTIRGVIIYSHNAYPYAQSIAVDPSTKKALGSNSYRYKGFVFYGYVSVIVKVVVNCNSGRYKILMPKSGGVDSKGNDRPSKTHDFGWETDFRIDKGEGLCN